MPQLKPFLAAAAIAAVTGFAAPATADKIDDAIGKAADAYKKGSLAVAVQELQYAVTKISERLSKVYAKTFPAPMEGWKAGRVKSTAGNAMIRMSGQVMNRRYRQTGGRGRVDAQMIVDNPAMQSYMTLFSNPAYARQAGYDRVSIDGVPEPAMVKFDEDRKRGEAILVTGGRILVRLSGRRIDSADVLTGMIKAWKIAEARKVAGIK